jgi:hypothetical protein
VPQKIQEAPNMLIWFSLLRSFDPGIDAIC